MGTWQTENFVIKTVGFIGTGTMGNPMAHKLLAGGHDLYIHDICADSMEELKQSGAIVCNNAKEVAQNSDIVFLMVLTAAEVEAVIFGPDGAINGLQAGNLVVCMSSIPATVVKSIAVRLQKSHIGFLDAPVSGGRTGAKEGSLAIMVGGENQDFDTAMPYFTLLGSNINLVGSHGSGQTAKAANQIIVSITRAAVGEALLFALRDGADPEQVRQALMGGLAQSATLETYGPRQSTLANPVEFGSPILKKDINNVVAAATELGVDLPFASLTRQMYNEFEPDDDRTN